ncbi:DUF433 domain-containing protein [Candidatus Parcubacteria bacterium]|nr:MAG: DUF433 domain-containing protein [Candidatus Parcubacteria bacterium]
MAEKQAYGWSPEELQYQHPHLTLGQVYSALAYYADHSDELDAAIEAELEGIDRLQHQLKQSKLRDKLRAQGLNWNLRSRPGVDRESL